MDEQLNDSGPALNDAILLAVDGSDRQWFDATGGEFCGCGTAAAECHPGQPCGDVAPLFPDPMREETHGVCDLCAYRVATGQIRRVREGATDG